MDPWIIAALVAYGTIGLITGAVAAGNHLFWEGVDGLYTWPIVFLFTGSLWPLYWTLGPLVARWQEKKWDEKFKKQVRADIEEIRRHRSSHSTTK